MVENEATILQSVNDLHQALYDHMVAGMVGVVPASDCMGYDSGFKSPTLPAKGIKIVVTDLKVDRTRPTPLEGTRVEENLGNVITKSYGGVVYTGYEGRRYRYPLPVEIIYSIYTWSHRAIDQFEIDHAVLKTFPERGILQLPIQGNQYDFPVEILTTQTLDDLKENIRERVYQLRVEAWITGHIPDRDGKIITSVETQFFARNPDEVNLPGGNIPDLVLELKPDV